jgi:hypothetical protein
MKYFKRLGLVLLVIVVCFGCSFTPKRPVVVSVSAFQNWDLVAEKKWYAGESKENSYELGKHKIFVDPNSKMFGTLMYFFDDENPSLMACWTKAPNVSEGDFEFKDYSAESDIVAVFILYENGKAKVIEGKKGWTIKFDDITLSEEEPVKAEAVKAVMMKKNGEIFEYVFERK